VSGFSSVKSNGVPSQRKRRWWHNVNAELEAVRGERHELAARVSRADAEVARLREKMEQTTSRLQAANDDNATLHEEVETLNAEQEQLRNRLSTADDELASLHGQVTEARAARDEARSDVVAGRVQHDRMVAVLQQHLVHYREREREQDNETGWKSWVGKHVRWIPWMVAMLMFMIMFTVVWRMVNTSTPPWGAKSWVPWNGSLPLRVSMPTWREGVAWLTSHTWAAVVNMYWLLNLLFVAAGMLSLVSKVVPVDSLARRSMTAAARRLLGMPNEDVATVPARPCAARRQEGNTDGDDDGDVDASPSSSSSGNGAMQASERATNDDAIR